MTAAASTRSPLASAVRAVAWLGALALGHIGLTAAGATLPAPPPPWETGGFLDWLGSGDVAQTSFALLRLVGLVTIWYLAALTVLVLVARVPGLHPIGTIARGLALPWARRLINHALGAGLALTLAGGVVPLAGAGTAMADPAPVTTVIDHPDPGGAPVMVAVDDTPAPVMEQVPDTGADIIGVPTRPVGRSVARATASMHLLDDEAAPATWTIASGDHLWHVAAATLESHWHQTPTEPEVAAYWQAVIEHNRDRLAVPGDPDLVYPGQVFELPAVPPAPAR